MPDTAKGPGANGWQPTAIEGVLHTRLTRHADSRGSFTELWRASWTEGLADRDFVQSNRSRSASGVLRGLHLHRRQADLWIVSGGQAFVALVDVRAAVAGTGPPHAVTLDLGPDEAVYIPRLVAHGFLARSELELIYFVTNEFDASDELGFRWDDAEVGVAWPMAEPVLSQRDAVAPPFSVVLEDLRQAAQSERA